jgi:hypothetical protein
MKKSSMAVFVLVAVFGGRVWAAEEDNNSPTISVAAEVGVHSKYVGERSGAVFTDSPVEQAEIVVSTPWLDLSIWNSAALERRADKTDGDEVDYTISRADEVFLGSRVGKLGLEYGVSYYDFSQICHGTRGDATAYFVEASKALAEFEPSFQGKISGDLYTRIETDVTTAGSESEGGTYVSIGARASNDESLPVRGTTDIFFTRDDGAYGMDPDWIFTYKLGLDIDHWGLIFSPGFTITIPFHGSAETVLGLSVSREI